MTPAFSWAARKAASASGVNGLTILGPAKPSASIPSPRPSTLLSCPGVRLTSSSEESREACPNISVDEVAGEHSNSSVSVNLSSVGLAIIVSRHSWARERKDKTETVETKKQVQRGAGRVIFKHVQTHYCTLPLLLRFGVKKTTQGKQDGSPLRIMNTSLLSLYSLRVISQCPSESAFPRSFQYHVSNSRPGFPSFPMLPCKI